MNCKRKDLTLKEKINVLEYANANKCTQLELAKKFGISQAQVSKLLKNKEKVINAMKCNANLNLKRQRTGKESAIEDALLQWLSEVQTLNVPVNGLMLSQKAEDIAKELNINNFKATNGWLCRWKKRNQISFKKQNPVEIYDAAVNMMNKPWNNISPYSPYIVKNYFTKCKFSSDILNEETVASDDETMASDNETTASDNELYFEKMTKETLANFANLDSDLETSGEISEFEPSKKEMHDNNDDDSDKKCTMNKTPSSAEVTDACNTIKCFLQTKSNVDFDLFYKLENHVTNLLQLEKKQSKDPNSFSKKSLALSAQTKNFKYAYSVPARVQREELQVVAEALGNLRRCFPANDPRQHTLDTVEQSLGALLERINALEMAPPSALMSSPLLRRSNSEKEAPHSLPILHHGETSDIYQEDFGGTKVVYYMDKSLTPFRCILHKRIGEATLRDFKLLFDRPGQFRYHFKTLDPEFGMVKEEVLNDDDILPGWDSKIVAWIEEECS